jgi:hypothetical protein
MTSHIAAQTEKTLLHHLQAFRAGDVDAITKLAKITFTPVRN